MSDTPVLEARDVVRRFGAVAALDGASLALGEGEIAALIGASGSGKSTLLRVLAGLEPVTSGQVLEAGREVSAPGRIVPPERRGIGLVFQDFALFPHLDALSNVMFGLKRRDDARSVAASWLDRMGLSHRTGAYPHQLSGGEQQRVALARALAPEPKAMLLDEPFSGLDPYLRADLQESTLEALRAAGTPALFVSHDTEEALAVADRVAVMQAGKVVQAGVPADVHAAPVSLTVARALGPLWIFQAKAAAGRVETPMGTFACTHVGAVHVAGRPEDTLLDLDPDGPFQAVSVRGVGRLRSVRARLVADPSVSVEALVEAASAPVPGQLVHVRPASGTAMVFPVSI
jgi:iron(III) transport system ATP-binding protein